MSLSLTLTLFVLSAGAFVFSAWQTRKEPDPAKGPRLIPWTLLSITLGFWLLLLVAHLLSFVGIETGGRFNSRMGL
jgi:hypothetical protein